MLVYWSQMERLLGLIGVKVSLWYEEMDKTLRCRMIPLTSTMQAMHHQGTTPSTSAPHTAYIRGKKNQASSKQRTLVQYFGTTRCLVCDKMATNALLCPDCSAHSQSSAVSHDCHSPHDENMYSD